MRKRRIGIYLGNSPSAGGLFQYSLTILESMESFRDTYDVVAVYLDTSWKQYLNCTKVEAHHLVLHGVQRISQFIHELQCDLFVYPSQSTDIYLSEIVPDIPFVMMICDLNFYFDKEIYNHGNNISALEFDIRLRRRGNMCNRAQGIIVDSELGKQQIIQLYGEACLPRIYVLPYTVPAYIEKPCEISAVDFPFVIPDKYIFYCANFSEHKNHKNLILAVKKLQEEGIIVNLVLCGNRKAYYKYILKLIKEEGVEDQVIILPYVSNNMMVYLYKHARAMMMPTFVGPTNIPPLEGMTLGCPVAVSNIGAMPEQVGRGGMLFDPYDVEDIAKSMRTLWQDDEVCKRLIEIGYTQAEKFSNDNFQKKLYLYLNDCIRKIDERLNNLQRLVSCAGNYKSVLCYGAGEYGYFVYRFLFSKGIHITAFFDLYSTRKFLGDVPIIRPNNFQSNKENVLVILTIDELKHEEIIQGLSALGFRNYYRISWKHEIEEIYYSLNMYPYNLQ